ncbi:aldolase [Collybia nuda]|uniref:Aldolase n=1 Tax=Collybia nuda TaxID=64659 RepID=A0A9P6CB68_9AGAR|nr:aldolase [Collybia nuda]
MSNTLLSQIHSVISVDVDSMDPDVARRHTSQNQTFCNMTSNQAIMFGELTRAENVTLIKDAIAYVNNQPNDRRDPTTTLQDIVDVVTVLLAKRVYPHLQGKVLTQISPSVAYNVRKTIEYANKLVSLFEAHGIPKTRLCIKVPATPESLVACQLLRKDNINTSATCVFSVAQAQAAAQAGCSYVIAFFNELRVHSEPSLWKEYKDTATEHPASPTIQAIIQALKGSETLVMAASIVSVAEVLALVSFRPNHITISAPILDQLGVLPASDLLPIGNTGPVLPEAGIDYLAKDAVLLKEAFMKDLEASRRVVDALTIFDSYEMKIKEYIQSIQGA